MAFPAHRVCLQPSDAYVEELLAGALLATAALTLPSRSYLSVLLPCCSPQVQLFLPSPVVPLVLLLYPDPLCVMPPMHFLDFPVPQLISSAWL